MTETYVICGASGKTGGFISKKLLEKNKNVRIIARNKEKVKKLIELGAKPFIGDLKDPVFTASAFEGATTAYVLIPPNNKAFDHYQHQMQIITPLIESIKKSTIKNIVALSSIGAQIPLNTGFVAGLHQLEEKLKNIENLNVLILRCAYIMDNLRTQIQHIEKNELVESALIPTLKFPCVALKDVAEMAFQRISSLDFTGFEIMDLPGPEDINFNEITTVFSKTLENPNIKFKHLSLEEQKSILLDFGLTESAAFAQIEYEQAINSGELFSNFSRTNLNKTKTTFENFANDLIKPFKETHSYYNS